MQASALTVAVEALSAELRATEGALAHWREDANRLRAQLRALRHTSPADEVTYIVIRLCIDYTDTSPSTPRNDCYHSH